jgi:hypothetical protein
MTSLRALNRATLHRQLLLHRTARPAAQAVAHLAGMQSQAPLAPYVGLWTRLADFRPAHLENLLTERAVVRAHVMRNTVHLTGARDFTAFDRAAIEAEGAGLLAFAAAGADVRDVQFAPVG